MDTLNMITVSTTVNAPLEKVWEAFNSPEQVTKWCFASDDWHAPSASSEFKVGGKANTRMEAKEGSFGFDFWWIYDSIEPMALISYTMGDGRQAEVKFEPSPEGIVVTEKFDPEQMNSREMQQAGWQAILDNFKKYVESN